MLVIVGCDEKRMPISYDTDDLEQIEYYYFRKAESLNEHSVARDILCHKLTAHEIENNSKYAWLAD